MTTPDPAAFFRQMLGKWERMANSLGGEAMRSEDWARSMHQASGAAINAQTAMKAVSDRALAAANMPSKSDVDDLAARLGRIEDTLARIEAAMGARPVSMAPRPTRGRKPPATA